jgi:DNA-binding transcriptional LysR family regulator
MYVQDSWCKTLATKTLESHVASSRVSYMGTSTGGLIAGVRAGLAIAPLSRSCIPEECTEFTLEEGFPVINYSNVVLMKAPNGSAAAVSMSEAIRAAFR